MPNQYRNQLQGVGFENDLHNRPAFTCYSGIHYHSIFKARVKPAGYLLLRRPRTRMSADGMSGKLTTVVVTAGSRISADNSPKRSSSMIHYLSPSEIVLWACAAAGQAILSFLLFKSASGQRYPAFSHYVYYVTAKSIVLFYIACSYKYAIYFWAYYPASFLACLLMVPVIMEIFLRVYGPARALPAGTIRALQTWILPSCAMVLIGAATFQIGHNATYIVRIMATAERMLISAILVFLLVLLGYSTRLGLSWRSRIAGVAIGFVLFLSFNVVSAFFRGNAPPWLARITGSFRQLSYLLVFIYWCWRFRNSEPVVQLSSQQTQLIKDELMKVRQEGPCGIRT